MMMRMTGLMVLVLAIGGCAEGAQTPKNDSVAMFDKKMGRGE